MYRRGVVEELDTKKHKLRVKFPEKQNVISPWLDVLVGATAQAKGYGLPEVGTLVAVMMDDKDEDGCVLGAIYTDVEAPTVDNANIRRFEFGDGGVVEYNRTTHVLRIDVPVGGKLELGGTAEPLALGDKVKAELDKIKVTTDSLASELAAHIHPTGAPGAPTSPPTPPTSPTAYAPSTVGSAKARSA